MSWCVKKAGLAGDPHLARTGMADSGPDLPDQRLDLELHPLHRLRLPRFPLAGWRGHSPILAEGAVSFLKVDLAFWPL